MDLSHDDFLGGRLRLAQPRTGYRAGIDPILLAAATDATGGQSVLELGCGAGAALLSLGRRVNGLSLTGVELQPDYHELARLNAEANAIKATIILGDLRALPADLRQQRFDHVIMNPPYFDRAASSAAEDAGRDIALGGETPLADWIDVAARRLAPRGHLTMIQRIERLPEVLAAASNRLGSVVLCPIAARTGRDPKLFLLQARKGGRAAFRCTPPMILHRGSVHEKDGDDYSPDVSNALRNGAGLPVFQTGS